MSFGSRCLLAILLLHLVAGLLPPAVTAQATPLPDLGSPAILPVWGRTDYPVADGKVLRSYYFGPSAILRCPAEEYQESPGGTRLVTYLDKARLELANPADGTVSAGLLAKELISGRLQVGDAAFRMLEPAAVPVAGDPIDSPAPTYASFVRVATLEGAQIRATSLIGVPVTQTLNRAGEVGDEAGLARYGVTLAEYRDELGHHIPSVFADFFARRGMVAAISAVDSTIAFNEDAVLIDWVRVMGLPLAEPYWARVPVGGVTTWVLTQPYERRVITYTPDNAEAFRVEMGNIGRHYQAWRHPDGTCTERAASAPTNNDVPASPATNTLQVAIAPPIGTVDTSFILTVSGWQAGEALAYWFTDPNKTVWYPRARQVEPPASDASYTLTIKPSAAFSKVPLGLWAVTVQGVTSGRQGVVYFRVADTPSDAQPAAPLPASPYDGSWKFFSSYLDNVLVAVDRGSVRAISGVARKGNCRVSFQQTFTHEAGRINEAGVFFVRAEWEKFGIVFQGTFTSPQAVKGTGEFDIRTAGCRGAVGFGWEGRPEPRKK